MRKGGKAEGCQQASPVTSFGQVPKFPILDFWKCCHLECQPCWQFSHTFSNIDLSCMLSEGEWEDVFVRATENGELNFFTVLFLFLSRWLVAAPSQHEGEAALIRCRR